MQPIINPDWLWPKFYKGFYGITIFDGFAQILYLYKKIAV